MSMPASISGLVLACLTTAAAIAAPLDLRAVPLSAQSPRLLGMSMDDDGTIWIGSTHRRLYRYDPPTGGIEEITLPYDSSISQTICVGSKVYLLGQSYPRLIIYNRITKKFSEAAYPATRPDVWYGTKAIDGRHFYLFDRGSAGVIKWDSTTDTGQAIPYPYKTLMPSSGRFVARDRAIWCAVWDFAEGQYIPIGIARLDVQRDEFTGWFPFPKEDADDQPFSDPATTIFYPFSLKGKIVPFDFSAQQWRRPIDVPEFGQRFGFLGGGPVHNGRCYFSMSTYNGTTTGCDGKPYHFYNGMLEFDPTTRRFEFLTLDVPDAYYQVSYALSAGGHFFAAGNDIRESDGTLSGGKIGRAIFWQSQPVEKE
jgi:hypothetical protein